MTNLFLELDRQKYSTSEFVEFMKEVFKRRGISLKDLYEITREFEKQGWEGSYEFLQVVIRMQDHAQMRYEMNAE